MTTIIFKTSISRLTITTLIDIVNNRLKYIISLVTLTYKCTSKSDKKCIVYVDVKADFRFLNHKTSENF